MMPRAERLTAHGQRLLDILQAHGGWMSRVALARAMFRENLNTHSVAMLNNLVEQRRIEVRSFRHKNGATGYEYRIKP